MNRSEPCIELDCIFGVYSNPHIFWGHYFHDAFDFVIMKSRDKLISEGIGKDLRREPRWKGEESMFQLTLDRRVDYLIYFWKSFIDYIDSRKWF